MKDDRLISLNAAIALFEKYGAEEDAIALLESLPSTCHLLEDGTLIVKVPNLSAVHRVIVDEENSQYCKTFYQDGDEEDGKDGVKSEGID